MVEFRKFGYGYFKALEVMILCVVFFFLGTLPQKSAYAEGIGRGAVYAVMETESGRLLSASGHTLRRAPASTTKILTAICVIENADVDSFVTIAPSAVGVEGSSIYLKAGERIKIVDLLYGLMLRSGNDAATALAEATSGNVEKFVRLMNDTAFKIGAYSSHFVNPHGLHDEKHYTTAEDLAKITAYAYKLPLFKKIVSTKNYTFERNGSAEKFVNKNKILSLYEGANGVKTGYTKASGRCLVSGADREGMQLVCVVLDEGDMWNKSMRLLDAAFSRYSMHAVFDGAPFVVDGKAVRVSKPVYYPLAEGEKLTYEYVLNKDISSANAVAGYAQVKISNHLIFSEKLYTI